MKRILNVVAGAIIKDKLVFAAQRGNKGKTAFKYEFPGGKIESGETPEAALARELKEELSIDVKVCELITEIVDEYDDLILKVSTYRCELISGTPILSEHINMAWADKVSIDSLDFAEADQQTIKIIKEKYL